MPLIPKSAPAAGGSPATLGYLPWWMAPGWRSMPLPVLSRIVFFDAAISEDGSLLDRQWAARAAGVASADAPADIALTIFDHTHFDALFADAPRRERLLAGALRELQREFVSGLHLDIEGYAEARPGALAGFRSWLKELDEHRRKLGKSLSAFFPASDSFVPYDREAAQRMDYWVAQIYDAHWVDAKTTGALVTRSNTNPVAIPRVLKRLSALEVSAAKILLSVPLYGWEWPADSDHPGASTHGRGRLLTYAETPQELMPNDRLVAIRLAREHGLRRDSEDTPYYAYRDGTQWRQGWFEDMRSLMRKLEPERTQDYRGLAFFPLGYDNGEIVLPLLKWWSGPR